MGTSKKRAAPPTPATRGRPPIHREPWSKVSVVLLDRQVAFLDALASQMRRHSGSVLSRAQILRATIDALAQSGINLTTARSEAEIAHRLARKLLR